MRKATYGLAAVCVVVFVLCVGVGGAFGSAPGDVAWLTVTLSTPKATTPSRVTPEPSETPQPTATYITPTSPPPEWTATPRFDTETPAPDSTPTPTPMPTPRVPDGEDDPDPDPTWDCNREYDPEKCLAPTGSGDMPPNVAMGLTAIGMVLFLGVAIVARGLRNAPR